MPRHAAEDRFYRHARQHDDVLLYISPNAFIFSPTAARASRFRAERELDVFFAAAATSRRRADALSLMALRPEHLRSRHKYHGRVDLGMMTAAFADGRGCTPFRGNDLFPVVITRV